MQTQKEKFNHTVGILVSAYLNGTLAHENCYACAVGNLVASGLGATVIHNEGIPKHHKCKYGWSNGEAYPGETGDKIDEFGWGAAFSTSDDPFSGKKKQTVSTVVLNSKRVKQHINATGYEWHELARIESAFESADKRKKDPMFDGLMKVVDVLCDIHGMNEPEKQESKALFVKA